MRSLNLSTCCWPKGKRAWTTASSLRRFIQSLRSSRHFCYSSLKMRCPLRFLTHFFNARHTQKCISAQSRCLFIESPHRLTDFLGNQPFSTRFFCSNSSNMLQNDEKAITPKSVDQINESTQSDAATNKMPARANTHQHLVPKWYSAFITMGWNSPMIKKVAAPMISPV